MMKLILSALAITAFTGAFAQTSLDYFVFDDALFGDSLLESDGGTFSFSNWLNVNNASPGNPALLTGANFDTGIANIGLSGAPTYTISYSTPIINHVGDDLGIVVARYTEDNIVFAVSTDGVSFSSNTVYGPSTALDTGVHKRYFYGGGGPFDAELFVQPVDLSDFGLNLGDSILATRTGGFSQLDLVRVAGFAAVPEPGSMAAIGLGVAFLSSRRRARGLKSSAT